MNQSITNFLSYGLFNLPWWGYIVFTLAITHITILSVTIFLHRHQAHRGLDLHPIMSHFFRLWIWLTTGMVTKEWTAIHRKHHAFSDRVGDPHSPQVFGLKTILRSGVELYQEEARNPETMKKYGGGTPDDWLERNLYAKHSKLGVSIMLVTDIILFGPIGLSIWALQMIWIPLFAAGIINGVGHFFGYRNFPVADKSTNIIPWGIFIGGEELHNNHHTFGTSAKFSYKWYEFDYGWMWIKILSVFRLAKVKKKIPTLTIAKTPKLIPDNVTLEAIISNRYHLAMRYAKAMKQDCKLELAKLQGALRRKLSWGKMKVLLSKDEDMLTHEEKGLIVEIKASSPLLKNAFNLRSELAKLWMRSTLTREELLNFLQNWCSVAEASGIIRLENFSAKLRAAC